MLPIMKQWLLRLLMRRMTSVRGSMSHKEIRTIALWQFGGIGDMLLATPVILALEKAFPEVSIHFWCSNPSFASFLQRFKSLKSIHLFSVYDFDSRTLLRSHMRAKLRQIGDAMAEQKPDMLVNLHVPALLDWWAVEWWLIKRLAVPYSLGFDPHFLENASIFNVSLNAARHDSVHYTRLYQLLLQASAIDCEQRTVFPLFDADKKKVVTLLAKQGIAVGSHYVCLHIGGRRLKVEGKMWSIEYFSELARCLIDAGLRLILIGVQSEHEMGKILCEAVPDCVNLIGCTQIQEMATLISMSDGFIGHDSGPFHVAVAVGTPCVAICGRSDAEPEYLQYNLQSVVALTASSPDKISVNAVVDAAWSVFNGEVS